LTIEGVLLKENASPVQDWKQVNKLIHSHTILSN